jgi:HD-like signal output (HDOD) protein
MKPTNALADRGRGTISEIDLSPPPPPPGGAELLALAKTGVIELPVHPTAAAEVMRLCQMANLPFDRMAGTIVQEPALAARVLQLANSAFYGSGRPVANISHALMRVGERGLRSVLLGAASGRVMNVRGHPELTKRLQVRSVGVAVGAEALLRRVGSGRDDAFAAGLLHDLGWAVGVGLAARYREKLPPEWATDSTAMLRAVDSVHSELGALVTEQWRFPPTLTAAIRWHHDPGSAVVGAPIAHAVAGAIKLLDRMGIVPEAPPVEHTDPVFARLGVSQDDHLELRREMWTELERLQLVRDRRRAAVPVRVERRLARKALQSAS